MKKDVWIDDKCVGETAANVFFYTEVVGDEKHTISTESEFSRNDLVLETKKGENYFIRQYIKFGLFVGGAGLELIDTKEGKEAVLGLELAKKGICG